MHIEVGQRVACHVGGSMWVGTREPRVAHQHDAGGAEGKGSPGASQEQRQDVGRGMVNGHPRAERTAMLRERRA